MERLDFGQRSVFTQFLAVRTLDQSTGVRLAAYQRLHKECMDISETFRESDRLTLICNGLHDYDQTVLESCRVYLVQQFCLKPEHKDEDLVVQPLQAEWLAPLETVMPKLNLL